MGGRHQPENGADSPDGLKMTDLPRPDVATVIQHLAAMGVPKDQWAHEANKVLLADSLGRAIHVARRDVNAVLNELNSCFRITDDEQVQRLPYGYGPDKDGFECNCESIATDLVARMTAQAVVDQTKTSPVPGVQ